MYLLSSSSHNELPCERFTKNGYGSMYLTGLLTPDGMTFLASENNFFDFVNTVDLYAGIIILN